MGDEKTEWTEKDKSPTGMGSRYAITKPNTRATAFQCNRRIKETKRTEESILTSTYRIARPAAIIKQSAWRATILSIGMKGQFSTNYTWHFFMISAVLIMHFWACKFYRINKLKTYFLTSRFISCKYHCDIFHFAAAAKKQQWSRNDFPVRNFTIQNIGIM